MTKMDTFSKRLQYLINVINIIPADLVRHKIGNAAQISKWLSGSTKTPSLKTLNRLSAYFNCDKGWLADGTGEPFSSIETDFLYKKAASKIDEALSSAVENRRAIKKKH